MMIPPQRRRKAGARDPALVVADSHFPAVRQRVAAQVPRLVPSDDAEALRWIEAVSEFDAPEFDAADLAIGLAD
jgi:hypothetical protein